MNREDTVRNAETLLLQGDLEGAIGEYVRLVAEHPRDADLLFALARIAMEAGKDVDARAALTRLLSVAPERHEDVTRLAEAEMARGEVESAFGCIDVAADAAILAGDWDAAIAALETFLRYDGTHAAALSKLASLRAEAALDVRDVILDRAGATVERESIPAEVDLTDALMTLDMTTVAPGPPESVEPPPQDVETALEGLRARRGRDQDAAEQYELGMQLIREGAELEAVFHLRSAARDPMWRFGSAVELGRLYSRRGEWEQGIEWLERAAEVPAPSVDDGHAVLYDLADALERCGESARSLAVLMELEAAAGSYRDTADRISRLLRAQAGSSR